MYQNYLEMTISDKAVAAIKSSNIIMGKLMVAFNRGQNTIENWMNSEPRNILLTTPDAVRVITQNSDLTEDDILVEDSVAVTKE